jgi:2-methylcitrate dehydratase
MDRTTETLVDFAIDRWKNGFPDSAMQASVNRMTDAAACAIAGYQTPPAQVAIRVASTVESTRPVTVFGAGLRSAAPYAVFANTTMVRTLDWNDGMLAPGGGHPSDMIPAVLAAGEQVDASGEEVVRAVVIAYESLGSLGWTVDRVKLGLDQGLFMGAATAVAVGLVHGLDRDQLGHAVALSIVPSIPLMATRRGALSMWKGAATADTTMHATTMVAYAQQGMTGPVEPFDGAMGVKDILTGEFELRIPAYDDGPYIVQIAHQKMVPAESHAQATVAYASEIRSRASVDKIERIDIEAYETLVAAIGRHASVWNPQNRETADHSLPYLLSVALHDGAVTQASFTPERIADPALRPFMQRIHITERPEFTAQYRPPGSEIAGSPRVRITVTLKSGDTFATELTYPRGHVRNPMTGDDIDAKWDRICAGTIPDSMRDSIRSAWWDVRSADSIRRVVDATADFGQAIQTETESTTTREPVQ